MRLIITALLLIFFTGSLKAQSADDLSKFFLDRYYELSNGSYERLYKQVEYGADTVREYAVPVSMGADKADLYTTDNGKFYRISFLKSNAGAKGFAKTTVKAFRLIATDPAYKIIADKNSGKIFKDGAQIMWYWIPDDDLYEEYVFVDITDPVPASSFLADESSYKNHFPTVPLASKSPQIIIQYDKDNPKSYKLCNGVFVNGLLQKGYQKFTGYNDFLNGLWYSDHWYYGNDALSTDVIFIPEGTKDSIYGHLNNNIFYHFYPDSRYDSKKHASSFADDAPLWLRTAFEKHLNDEYIKETSGTYEEVTARSRALQDREADVEKHRCRYCGGSGLVGTGTFIMGKEVNKTCPRCNGTGRIE